MWRDLRYALGGLGRTPIVTVTAVLTIGLTIGANATVFGLIDGLWFRPPAVSDAASIVWVFSTTPIESTGTWSYPEYLELRDGTRSFAGVVALGRRGATLADGTGAPQLLLVNVVSPNFFSVLGVQAAHGRLFGPDDARALEERPGVVLGNAFWRSRFGGDPSIVGQTVRLGRSGAIPVEVLAVLPASFREMYAAADRDLWMPPQTWTRLANGEEFTRRDERWFDVIARRRDGVSARLAHAEVATVAASMAREFPATNAGRGARVIGDLDYRFETGGPNALALLGLVLLVVLITSVNVANLLLARAAARSRELAVRVAIGATRRRLLAQLMTESAVLGTLGAAAGSIIALWLIGLLPSLLVSPPGLRPFQHFAADSRVLLFTLMVTLATTILFGAVPSWIATRAGVAPLLNEGSGLLGARRLDGRLRTVLVTAQIAVSLVLLCAAGVLTRSFLQARNADLGFERKPLLAAWVTPSPDPSLSLDGLDRLGAIPGVRRATVAIRAPLSLSGGGLAQPIFLPHGRTDPAGGLPRVKFNAVGAGYFETLGIDVIEGRVFTDADERPGPPVLVVSEHFAREFFPGGHAVDSVVRLGGVDGVDHRIAGVVENAVINQIGEASEPYFYLPYWRGGYGEITYVIESATDPAALAATVRDTLKSRDRRLEPRRLITMAQYIEYSGAAYRATAVLAGVLGAIGLVLTAVGIYGVIAYRTARRTREFGIRMALGSGRRRVLSLVVTEGLRSGALGLAVGLPAALLATRWLSSLLFGIGPWDVTVFVAAAITVISVVCAATFVPAWRAMRVNPAGALRHV